jgi:osmotically-inducible protein OsmY
MNNAWGIYKLIRKENHMKPIKLVATFCFTAALLFTLGCAATPTKESTGEYIDDSVITTKVKEAIYKEPTLKSAEINVETYKGVVQLSGFVSSQANMDKAAEVARGVKGVQSVKSDMHSK